MGLFPFIFHDHGFFKHFMRGKYMPTSSDLASTFQGIEWGLYFSYVLSTYLSNGHEIILMYLKHWLWPIWPTAIHTYIHTHTHTHIHIYICGLPRWFRGKESNCQCRRYQLDPWAGKVPWRRKCQPTPVSLPGKSHGQRSLAGIYGIAQLSDWAHTHIQIRSENKLIKKQVLGSVHI